MILISGLYLLPPVAHGDRELRLWSVHHVLFLLLLKERSPCPAPLWGPFHERQFYMNFSSVRPSHGLQFFLNCSSLGSLPQGAVHQDQPALLQRNLSSSSWTTSSPCFSTNLGVCRVVPLPYSQSSLVWLQLQLCSTYFLLLK